MCPMFKSKASHIGSLPCILLFLSVPVYLLYPVTSLHVSLVGKWRSRATWWFSEDDTVRKLARKKSKQDLLTTSPVLCLNPSSILPHFYYAIKWVAVYEFIPRHIIAFISHQRTWDKQETWHYWLFSETQLFYPVRNLFLRLLLGTGARLSWESVFNKSTSPSRQGCHSVWL